MTDREILLIDCCIALGLSRDKTETVFRIVHTVEMRYEMLDWMKKNMESLPAPVDVIIAAGLIQMSHKNKEQGK